MNAGGGALQLEVGHVFGWCGHCLRPMKTICWTHRSPLRRRKLEGKSLKELADQALDEMQQKSSQWPLAVKFLEAMLLYDYPGHGEFFQEKDLKKTFKDLLK